MASTQKFLLLELVDGRLHTLLDVCFDKVEGLTFDRSFSIRGDDPETSYTTLQRGAIFKLTDSLSAFVSYGESFAPKTEVIWMDPPLLLPLEKVSR